MYLKGMTILDSWVRTKPIWDFTIWSILLFIPIIFSIYMCKYLSNVPQNRIYCKYFIILTILFILLFCLVNIQFVRVTEFQVLINKTEINFSHLLYYYNIIGQKGITYIVQFKRG